MARATTVRGGGASGAARRGAWGIARIISLIASIVAGILVAGILLIVLEANPSNDIVKWVTDAAQFLAGPFDGLFNLKNSKTEIAVNWGIAAAVYLIVGRLIARLIARV